jgi:uncharacterized membrane protein YqjE
MTQHDADPVRPMLGQPSIGDLIRKLAEDVSHLVRTEVQLVKTEVQENVRATVTPLVLIGAATIFFVAALLTLLGAIVGWLEPLVGAGWASFIVAVVSAIVGVVLLMVARRQLSSNEITPKRSLRSIGEDVKTIKESFK